jgi:ribulose-5-phosphate 4-epimerase/fuculose-1-phosphate aldolase
MGELLSFPEGERIEAESRIIRKDKWLKFQVYIDSIKRNLPPEDNTEFEIERDWASLFGDNKMLAEYINNHGIEYWEQNPLKSFAVYEEILRTQINIS